MPIATVYQAWRCDACGLKGTIEAPCTWDAKQFYEAALEQHEVLSKDCFPSRLHFSGMWTTVKPAGL